MVLYNYDSNDILTKPFENDTTPELVRVQTLLVQYLLNRGLNPSALCIDNDCPKTLKTFLRENSVNFQL